MPVAVENDVNAAALGEAHFGAGRGCQHFLCLTYGTGIGGAAILNGELYTGFHGAAGEFGHIVTHAGGRKCTCGGEGCYETYASTRALTREAESLLGHPVNGRELFALLHHGNQAIVQLVDSWIGEIAIGLAGLAYSLDPERIVLGGGIMKEPYLLPRLKQALDARLMPSYRDIALVPAQLGNTAGLMGGLLGSRSADWRKRTEREVCYNKLPAPFYYLSAPACIFSVKSVPIWGRSMCISANGCLIPPGWLCNFISERALIDPSLLKLHIQPYHYSISHFCDRLRPTVAMESCLPTQMCS